MNPRILNNILASQYFKEIYTLKGYNEILEEIFTNVTYIEPWTVGVSGIPSTFFCCLYKLMLTKLSDEQLKGLINNQESPYLKCAGFLYIRYLSEPNDLWNWYSNFILDDQEFLPTPDTTFKITIGEYIENLLTNYDYYGTRLPRIPVIPEREIKIKLMLLPEKRKRKKENIQNIHSFTYNTKCKAISTQDDEFHEGYIVETYGLKFCLVRFINGDNSVFKSIERSENKWYDQEMFLYKVNELKRSNEKSGKEPVFYSGEEVVDLGNIILVDKFESELAEEKKKKQLVEESHKKELKELKEIKDSTTARDKSPGELSNYSRSERSVSSDSYHRRKKHSKRDKKHKKRKSRSRSDSYNSNKKSRKRKRSYSKSYDSRQSSDSSDRQHKKKHKKRERSRNKSLSRSKSKSKSNEKELEIKKVESKQDKQDLYLKLINI